MKIRVLLGFDGDCLEDGYTKIANVNIEDTEIFSDGKTIAFRNVNNIEIEKFERHTCSIEKVSFKDIIGREFKVIGSDVKSIRLAIEHNIYRGKAIDKIAVRGNDYNAEYARVACEKFGINIPIFVITRFVGPDESCVAVEALFMDGSIKIVNNESFVRVTNNIGHIGKVANRNFFIRPSQSVVVDRSKDIRYKLIPFEVKVKNLKDIAERISDKKEVKKKEVKDENIKVFSDEMLYALRNAMRSGVKASEVKGKDSYILINMITVAHNNGLFEFEELLSTIDNSIDDVTSKMIFAEGVAGYNKELSILINEYKKHKEEYSLSDVKVAAYIDIVDNLNKDKKEDMLHKVATQILESSDLQAVDISSNYR